MTRLLATASLLVSAAFASPAAAVQVDSTELARALDFTITAEMQGKRIPGAVVIVIDSGGVVFRRGYGHADLRRRVPMDPARSLMRIGSVSKIFTATAAMQLVERGELDLHTDVNHYLREFQVPLRGSSPVTLHHLLTHTAGFDERLIGIAARSEAERRPLGAYLASELPPRTSDPGALLSYSNHGIALAGHLVETVAGVAFHEYVALHVLEPLAMTRSGFRPAPELLADRARGYEYVGGEHRELPLDYLNLDPAGGFFATADDMGRLLRAQFSGGMGERGRVLTDETIRLMHGTRYATDPSLPGWGYGWYEAHLQGHRLVLHTGGWRDFRTVLAMVPSLGVGMFISYNLADQGPIELQSAALHTFLRHLPPAAAIDRPEPRAGERPAIDGTYLPARRARRSVEKLIAATSAVHVRDGEVIGRQLGDVTFHSLRRGEDSSPIVATGGEFPLVYQRVSASPRLLSHQLGLLAACVAVALAAVVGWPTGWLRTRRQRGSPLSTTRALAGVGAGAFLAFIPLYPLAFIGEMHGGIPAFAYGMPPLAAAALALPLVGLAAAVAAAITLALAIRRGAGTVGERVRCGTVIAALAGLVVLAGYWNLLGFRY